MEYDSLAGYCKYVSNNVDVLKGIFVDKKIRFTQPAVLNDPIDCNPILSVVPCDFGEHTVFVVDGVVMPSTYLWYHIQLVESRINEFGILSLTKNPVSFDMWSKYANGHKGCVIELSQDFNQNPAFQSNEHEAYPLVPVTYVDFFAIDIRECTDTNGFFSLDLFESKFFYTKAARWATEKEHRLVRPLQGIGKTSSGLHIGTYRDFDTPYLGELPSDVIQSVTFGALMPRETKLWIIDKCYGTSIQFLQCMIYANEKDEAGLAPRVALQPLNEPAIRDKILELQPQLLLMANRDLLHRRQVQLSTIEDLPYYQGFEELVRLMYANRKASTCVSSIV